MRRFVVIVPCLVLLTVAAVRGESPQEAKATIAFLQKLQQPDGSFVSAPADPAKPQAGTLRATSAAVRALKYFGGELPEKEKVVKFVDSTFDKASGGFADTPGGKPDVFITSVGLMAVAELKMPQEKYVEPAVTFLFKNAKTFEEVRIAAAGLEAVPGQRAVPAEWLEKVVAEMRNPDGTYGKGEGQARDTGGAAVVVMRLGAKVEQPENVLKALKAGQRSDGGFGKADVKRSDLETSYRVMRAFHMMKEKPADVKALREFIAKCRNADGGYGASPGEPSTVGTTYDAGIILHWLAE